MILHKYIPREVLEKALNEINQKLGSMQVTFDELLNEKTLIENLLKSPNAPQVDRKHMMVFEAPSVPDKIKGLIMMDGPQRVSDIFTALANAGQKVSKAHISITLSRSKAFRRISDGRWDVVN